jgi:hypothetical protein
LRRFDLGVDDKAVERLVENCAHENGIGAAKIRAHGSICRRLHDRHFTRQQRLQRRDTAGVNQFEIDAVLFEMACL